MRIHQAGAFEDEVATDGDSLTFSQFFDEEEAIASKRRHEAGFVSRMAGCNELQGLEGDGDLQKLLEDTNLLQDLVCERCDHIARRNELAAMFFHAMCQKVDRIE